MVATVRCFLAAVVCIILAGIFGEAGLESLRFASGVLAALFLAATLLCYLHSGSGTFQELDRKSQERLDKYNRF